MIKVASFSYSFLLMILAPSALNANSDPSKWNSLFKNSGKLSEDSRTVLIRRSTDTENIHIGVCSEEQFEDWYQNEFPKDCQEIFNNASTLHQHFQAYCSPICGEMYFDYLAGCGTAGAILSAFYTSLCITNEAGIGCYNYILSEEFPNSKPLADEHCFPVNSTCTIECLEALQSLYVNLGCCVNTLYNQTLSHPVANYELWTQCGLSTPDYCGERGVSSSPNLESSLNLCSLALVLVISVVVKQ